MSYRTIIFLLWLILIPAVFVQGQSDSILVRLAEFIEDESDLLEIYEHYLQNPVNINTADRAELSQVPFFTNEVIDSLLAMRSRAGRFRSKTQIRPVLGKDLYELVRELITTRTVSRKRGFFIHKNYIPYRRDDPSHLGDPLYDYNKLHYQFSPQITAGMITQKDVGERNYLDFIHGFVTYSHPDWWIILGSYYLNFGEGLLFSRSFGQQKSAFATLPFRTTKTGGFTNLSSSENTGQFGVYSEIHHLLGLNWHFFFAANHRDAQLGGMQGEVTGFDFDGYHRTENEINQKDQIREQLIGLALIKDFNSLQLGLVTTGLTYDPEIQNLPEITGQEEFKRRYFGFSGSTLRQGSVFYRLQKAPLALSGEAVVSDKGAPGYSQSVFVKYEKIDLGLKYWRISKNFQSPYGRIFDDSSPFPQNDQGIYAGLSYEPLEKWDIRGYKLIKRELWRSYFYPLPTQSDEWLLESAYKFTKSQILVRFRSKESEEYIRDVSDAQTRARIRQQIWRVQLEHYLGRNIHLRSRWERTTLNLAGEQGTLLFQDFRYGLRTRMALNARITFFRTTSFASRLYEYESDLPGSFANYMLIGQGYKWYLLMKWRIWDWLDMRIKFRYQKSGEARDSITYLHRELRMYFQARF